MLECHHALIGVAEGCFPTLVVWVWLLQPRLCVVHKATSVYSLVLYREIALG